MDKLIKFLQYGTRIDSTLTNDKAVLIDDKGWSDIDTIINLLKISKKRLFHLVETDPQDRFEIHKNRIRAVTHSRRMYINENLIELTAYDLENLDCYYGIRNGERPYLQLSTYEIAKYGIPHVSGLRKRANIIYKINANKAHQLGTKFYIDYHGIICAKSIPNECITLCKD